MRYRIESGKAKQWNNGQGESIKGRTWAVGGVDLQNLLKDEVEWWEPRRPRILDHNKTVSGSDVGNVSAGWRIGLSQVLIKHGILKGERAKTAWDGRDPWKWTLNASSEPH